jgi:site-specific DNA-methyltransferase (adenine-specific)
MNYVIGILPEGVGVIDPFCGSGTTCIAALQNNRNYIAYDINEEYVKLSQKRINNHKFI